MVDKIFLKQNAVIYLTDGNFYKIEIYVLQFINEVKYFLSVGN